MPNTVNSYMVTDLGNVSLNPRGEYNATYKYEYLDLIHYKGGSYVCLAPLGDTISGISPVDGSTTTYWQCIAIPGEITQEYKDMYNEVINDANKVEELKNSIDTIELSIKDSETNAKTSETNAKASETNAKTSETKSKENLNSAIQSNSETKNMIIGFDQHVSDTISNSTTTINDLTNSAISSVVEQQNKSLNYIKNQADAYINSEEIIIRADLHQIIDDFNNSTNSKKQEIINSANDKINTMTTIYDNTVDAKNVAETASTTAFEKANEATTSADEAKTSSDEAKANAELVAADKAIVSADKTEIGGMKSAVESSVAKFESDLETYNIPTMNNDITELKSDLGNVSNDLTMLRAQACIFENESEILGLQVDYKNKTFTRLAGAVNLTMGSDFDRFSMFGGRRRCNVADDGTIVAWYGDADYAEDGSMGQVMVYQPKFYYLVCPVVYDPIDTGIGYHLRKANYYVSEKARAGFRLHPAFYDANGNELDYFLTSAYEGSIFDVSADAFLMNDEQVMTVSEDKFCSIAGVKPASGLTQNLTRPNIEQMAKNRGDGWHGDLIKQFSAEQMLMLIEMGMMNLQTAIARGIVFISDNNTYSCSSLTGSTASIGNGTGRATETINEKGGETTTETTDGKTAVCWRGKENFWGNIWKFVYGINIWGNGSMGGGQPYICNDFNFAESRNNKNYEAVGFTVANAGGYTSAMGYSTTCDWLFIASECFGNSSLPVGDYNWLTENLNGYRVTRLGGYWNSDSSAGAFCWGLDGGVGNRFRGIGGRLVYIPTQDSAIYNATIASWKEQMTV